jgi:5-(carboxyamino)imidazole ribonucleotide mutase
MATKPVVGILMGSDSDFDVMIEAARTLKEFGISYEIVVSSAHRSPERTRRYAASAAKRGLKVLITGAGSAAALAGVVAAETTLPVIGVPLDSSALAGVDALYATVQLPAGVPVATMAIGTAGATNAAVLAAQILAVGGDEQMAARLRQYKKDLAQKVADRSKSLQQRVAKELAS